MTTQKTKVRGLETSYEVLGEGKIPVLVLHGWGLSGGKYRELAEKILAQRPDLKFFLPDLPGFGETQEPDFDWSLDEYVEWVKTFADQEIRQTRQSGWEQVKNVFKTTLAMGGNFQPVINEPKIKMIIFAHSFGGRIAIKYATEYPQDLIQMILTGAAGIKHPLSLNKRIVVGVTRVGKLALSYLPSGWGRRTIVNFFYDFVVREKDYHKAKPRMKAVMKNALAEDLSHLLGKITTTTLLIWGSEDHSTPLTDGEQMRDSIRVSKLVVVPGANHALPYAEPNLTTEIILKHL